VSVREATASDIPEIHRVRLTEAWSGETDLAFNMTRFARSIDRAVWRLSGVPGGFGPARTARVLLLRDHAAASRCLSQVSRWAIRRIVVAHGEIIERDAKAQFLKAFAGYLNAPHAA
jgi:hypothetical protein